VLHSLCSRLGEAGTEYAVEALRSTYWGLQDVGAALLAEQGGPDRAGPFFDWFEHKLRPNDRPLGNWTPYHLLTAVRFAVRQHLHLQLASLLVKYWSHLADEEREWLALHWAGLFDAAGTPRAADQTPPPTSVGVLGTYLLTNFILRSRSSRGWPSRKRRFKRTLPRPQTHIDEHSVGGSERVAPARPETSKSSCGVPAAVRPDAT
jgi:hypothetical protein